MKYWIKFFKASCNGQMLDAMGSDGILCLDGRLSQYNMQKEALKYAQRMQHVKKFDAFCVCKGFRFFEATQESQKIKIVYPVHI